MKITDRHGAGQRGGADPSPLALQKGIRDAQGRRRAALDELRASVRRVLRDGTPVEQVRESVPDELKRVNAAHEMNIEPPEAMDVVEAAMEAHSRVVTTVDLAENPFAQLAQGEITIEHPVPAQVNPAPEPHRLASQKTNRDPATQARIDELRKEILAEAQAGGHQQAAIKTIQWAKQETSVDRWARSLLVELASFADPFGWCFPKIRTIATECGMSRRQVHRHLLTLQLAGLVAVVEQRGPRGARLGNRYLLAFWRTPMTSTSQGSKTTPMTRVSQPL